MASIQYGLPVRSPELERELRLGKVVLGGCVFFSDLPAWQCTQCAEDLDSERKLRGPLKECGQEQEEGRSDAPPWGLRLMADPRGPGAMPRDPAGVTALFRDGP